MAAAGYEPVSNHQFPPKIVDNKLFSTFPSDPCSIQQYFPVPRSSRLLNISVMTKTVKRRLLVPDDEYVTRFLTGNIF